MAKAARYDQLRELFREHQKRSKFVRQAYGTDLTISDCFILVEIDINPLASVTWLARRLNQEKSGVSRAVQYLVEAGYLTSGPSKRDGRGKELGLTGTARSFLAVHAAFNSAQLAEFTANVTIDELVELQAFFKTFADGMQAEQELLRPQESPLLIEMRRISRAIGIFGGSSFAGSGYSAVEWQIFSELHYSAGPVHACDLSPLLATSLNNTSRILARYERQGLIKRTPNPADKRSLMLSLTGEGEKALQRIQAGFNSRLETAFAGCTVKQLERFIFVFRKYLGLEQDPAHIPLLPGVRGELLQPPAARSEGRAFVVLQLMRLGKLLELPERLLAAGHHCFALRAEAQLGAVLELAECAGGYELINFAAAPAFEDTDLTRLFVQRVLRRLLAKGDSMQLSVPRRTFCPGWLLELGEVEERRAEDVILRFRPLAPAAAAA